VELPLELRLSADRQVYDAQLGRFVATGHVTALVAGGRIQADRLEFDPANRVLAAFGSVRFQRGQQYVQASRLRFSLPEGRGEMEDVYGVLDLDGTAQDLDLASKPSKPLPPPEPVSCPPNLPPPPEWHPYPWAVTAWGGQMYTANFGDTFLFHGSFRPEYRLGSACSGACWMGGRLPWSSTPTRSITAPAPSPAVASTRTCPSPTPPARTLLMPPPASVCGCGCGPG